MWRGRGIAGAIVRSSRWRELDHPVLFGVTTAFHGCFVHTGTRFVAVGRVRGELVTSTRRLVIGSGPGDLGAAVRPRAVAWSGTLLVGRVGERGNRRAPRPDGLAWTARSSGVAKSLEGVASNSRAFIPGRGRRHGAFLGGRRRSDGTVLAAGRGTGTSPRWRPGPRPWAPCVCDCRGARGLGRHPGLHGRVGGRRGLGAADGAWRPPGLDGLAAAAGSTVAVGEAGSVLLNAAANVPEVQVQALAYAP